MSRYRFIEAQREQYAVRRLCQLVQVPASGYYVAKELQQQQQPLASIGLCGIEIFVSFYRW